MTRQHAFFAMIALLATSATFADDSPYDATDRYGVEKIEGWTLRISDRFDDEPPKLRDDVIAEVRRQLVAIVATVPAAAVDDLQKIEIWVEVNNPLFPCMCYHPDERWLKAHGVNPAKTGHVELANAANFLSWTRHQPWMVLHELAHGYHHRFIEGGNQNKLIATALSQALEAGRYGEVDHVNGNKRQHYAATNPMEFFAEATEAYFGKNDFYPFDRDELQQYDPSTVTLLEKLWGVDPVTPAAAVRLKTAEDSP